MKVGIFAYSQKGCELALKIADLFDDSKCFAVKKHADNNEGIESVDRTGTKVKEIFGETDLLIFVGACGIAVRAIAPCLKSKVTDPACLVVDDCGNFVISLLSGHIGKANELCEFLSKKLNSVPVITTATDINNRFAIDSFANKNGFVITNMKSAMEISAQILTQDIPISSCDEISLEGLPFKGMISGNVGEIGVYIGYDNLNKPYEHTLKLIPKILHVGIGCRRGTPKKQIEEMYHKVLKEHNIDFRSVKSINSIDIKNDEEGLLEFCADRKLNINFFSESELNSIEGEFTSSEFVKKITGVDNVCERSAIKAAGEKSNLIIKKTVENGSGITLAVATELRRVNFE